MTPSSPPHVAILGAGVIGLSLGITLLDPGSSGGATFDVTIVAKDIPHLSGEQGSHRRSDGFGPSAQGSTPGYGGMVRGRDGIERGTDRVVHPATFASAWAGGHHVSDAKTPREKRHDQVTFRRMCEMAEKRPWCRPMPGWKADGPEPLVWVHQTEYFEALRPDGSHPAIGVLDWYPDYEPLPTASLPAGMAAGCTFSTLDINVPVYHRWLLARFLELGGRLLHQPVTSTQQALRVASRSRSKKVDLLVLAPGLGARSLEGLQDATVHPQRGQVVVVHAPWLSTPVAPGGRAKHRLPGYSVVRRQGGREAYIIPRGDGTVICGGTRIVNDWDPTARAETTQTILQRCLRLCPQLANPKRTVAHLQAPRVEEVEVLAVHVGLRPARTDGICLQRGRDVDGVRTVYSYGYGGWGYQASWGAAEEATEIIKATLRETGARSSSPLVSKL